MYRFQVLPDPPGLHAATGLNGHTISGLEVNLLIPREVLLNIRLVYAPIHPPGFVVHTHPGRNLFFIIEERGWMRCRHVIGSVGECGT